MVCFFYFILLAFQIAAKIGGDGVNPPPAANEFAYGGQKRPLEDGGKFPLNFFKGTKSSGTPPEQALQSSVAPFVQPNLFFNDSFEMKRLCRESFCTISGK